MKTTTTKILAIVMAAVMLTAALTACEFSIGTDKDKDKTSPVVGLWRMEKDGKIEMFDMKADGTFQIDAYDAGSGSHDVTTGKYTASDSGEVVMTDVIFNGEKKDESFTVTIEVKGETAKIDGGDFIRIPEKDVAEVKQNPTKPYTPGGGTAAATTKPTDAATTQPPPTAEPDGADGLERVVYKDTRGDEVAIPGGALSFAVNVVDFIPGNPWTDDPLDIDPNEILGVPDRGGHSNGKAITLGRGGIIILEFGVYIFDGPGNDIYVFEVGNDVECVSVEVSDDLTHWIYAGETSKLSSGVDMKGKVPAGGKYRYVRITDLDTYPNANAWPGADIDAVAAINIKQFDKNNPPAPAATKPPETTQKPTDTPATQKPTDPPATTKPTETQKPTNPPATTNPPSTTKPPATTQKPTNPPATTNPPTTTKPPATTQKPTEPPKIDTGLVVPNDTWYAPLGAGRSYLNLEFYSNGEFKYYIEWTTNLVGNPPNQTGGNYLWDETYKGTYTASNGKITLTFTSAQHRDSGGDWKTIPLPATLSCSYELYEDRYDDRDYWNVITQSRVFHKLKIGSPLPGANESSFKNGYTLYLFEENRAGGTKLDVPKPATFSWTGKWKSNSEYWGTFDLTQNGNTVTGVCGEGNFTGTVSNNTLTFFIGSDEYRLTMSSDGEKFSMEHKSGSGNWNSLNREAVRLP